MNGVRGLLRYVTHYRSALLGGVILCELLCVNRDWRTHRVIL